MTDVPMGTLTFLFSDIEGSSAHWERDRARMQATLAHHDAIVRRAIEQHGGFIFKTIGDSFCAAFTTAPDALAAAAEAQRRLHLELPAGPGPLRVRLALHTGAAEQRDLDYFGPPLNRVARLLAAAHGGQTLLSLATSELVRDSLPPEVSLRDLGLHRLKDLTRPEQIFQVLMPGLPSDFPPLRSLDAHPHNLPTQATPLIGREREVAAVTARLQRPDVRLLTLTGPGGTGKTRLGLQVAAELLTSYADGVCFVALAPIRDPALVVSTVAQALGIKEAGGAPLHQRLLDYLRDRRLLLLLDNFEQLLPAAPLLTSLLETAAGLQILVTSRAVLGVYGEHDFAVPPLSLPAAPRQLPVEALTQYEAVRLFIERAQAAQAAFSVTSENAPAIAEICARLDGLPLAIELAAARVRLLSPQALLARLDQRLQLLTGGARTLPTRQQTLRNTIDWSYELLDEAERLLFARLGVFVGGCTLASAEAVCTALPGLGLSLLDGLQSILDKSLLYQVMGADEEPRFLMLETIREYALEKLEQRGEAATLRHAHARCYLDLARQAQPAFFGPGQREWLARTEAELDNIRAALAWSLQDAEGPALGLQLAGMLWRFWALRGHIAEGRTWLEALLPHRHGLPPAVTWYALHTAGNLADDQGDLMQAERYWHECLAICQQLGNTRFVGHMLNNLGEVATVQAAYGLAEARYTEALALYREVGNTWGVSLAIRNLGDVAHLRGDYLRARQLFQQSMAIMREQGDNEAVARIIGELGKIAFALEDDGAAERHFGEAERMMRAAGSKPGLGCVLCAHGALVRSRGEYAAAAALIEEGLALQREIGYRRGSVEARYQLGRIALATGDPDSARDHFAECLRFYQGVGDRRGIAIMLEACAALAETQHSLGRAAYLLGAAAALRAQIGAPLAPADRADDERLLAGLRARMSPDGFAAAWQSGRQAPLDSAAELALAAEPPAPPPAVAPAPPPARPRDLMGLTRRELDVLRLVAQGLTDAEVGQALVISARTVNGHLSSIYSKLGVSSRTAATRIAIDNQLI